MSPTKARRACLHPGCPSYAVKFGRCGDHAAPIQREKWRAPRAEAGRGWYFTAFWRRLRLAVLNAEPICRACRMRGQIRPASDVDHIVPHRGDWQRFSDRTNLQPLCSECHREKSAREHAQRGK